MIRTMTTVAALSRNPELLRRIGVTLAVLLVYRIGCWVPLPGVEVGHLMGTVPHEGTLGRVSIMALGIVPLLSALVLAEVAMIAFPKFRSWAVDAGNRAQLDSWAIWGALVLATFQANGIAFALEDIPSLVSTPGVGFRTGVVVSLVGATAIVVWLASIITRHGIGSGFWIFVALPYAMSFAEALLVQASLWGPASFLTIAISIGSLALCTAALAALARTAPPLAKPDELAWAPILGFAGANWLLVAVLLAVLLLRWLLAPYGPDLDVDAVMQWQGAILLPVFAVPLFAILRRRSFATGSASPSIAAALPFALALTVLVAAGTALAYLPAQPLFPGPASTLILAAVGLMVAEALRGGQRDTTTGPSS